MASNEELLKRAQEVIPGGVNSPVRAFRSVGGAPYFVARAEGAHVGTSRAASTSNTCSRRRVPSSATTSQVSRAIRRADARRHHVRRRRAKYCLPKRSARRQRCDMWTRLQRHRSGDERDTCRARIHRSRQGRESRQLPRAQRRPAGGGRQRHGPLALPHRRGCALDGGRDRDRPVHVVRQWRRRAAVIVELWPPITAYRAATASSPACAPRARRGALLISTRDHRLRLATARRRTSSVCKPDLWCFGKVIGGGLPLARWRPARVREVLARSGRCTRPARCGEPIATAAGEVLGSSRHGAFDAGGTARPSPTDGRRAPEREVAGSAPHRVSVPDYRR